MKLRRALAAGLALTTLASCAAAPVTLYQLGLPALPQDPAPLGPHPVVIAIDRVGLPNALDTEDMLLRRGDILQRSLTGRWASRLSLSVTALITDRLAQSRPDVLVTDKPQTSTPSDRIIIDISRLDIAAGPNPADGTAALEANWTIIPADAASPKLRGRTQITATGPVGTDAAIVLLTTAVLNRLAGAIDIAGLR